jgi:Spy/CpxP family protein refolding chaperone
MKWPRLVLVVAMIVATAGAAAAQAPGPTNAAGGPAAKREKIKQRILSMRAWQLTQELALDEPTAARLFPVIAKYDDAFARLLRESIDLRKAGLDAAARGDDRALNDVIDKVVANQRARWDAEEARFKEVRKVLTPAQAARILVVLPQIDRRIQNQLRRALGGGPAGGRRRQRAGNGGAGAGNPDDDILDDDTP